MAQNITIKVTATDEGSLKKLVAQLKAAGHEIDMTATSHKRAGAAADDHHNRLAKGVSGVANSTKSFSKMAASIDGGNNSLVGAYAALAANIFAVTAAFNALKNAAEVSQVIAGLDAAGTRVGLTYSLATNRVRETSGGLLSLKQSATSTAQVLSAGFKSDDLVKLTQVAKDASFALGRDMSESMDRLTRGAVKLEPELLDELGIMVRLDESSNAYARTLHKTAAQLTATEKRQGFMNAVLAEGTLKFGGLADAAGGASGFTKLAASFTDLTNTIFSGINKVAGPLANLFASSPMALVGGLALFASSIKGQLMPGLVDSSKAMAANAKAAHSLALANIESSVSNIKYNTQLKTFFKDVNDGSITVDSLTKKLAELRAEKDHMVNTVPNTIINPVTQQPVPNWAKSGNLKNIRQDILTTRQALGSLNQAEAQTNLSNAVLLASNNKLGLAFKELSLSIKTYKLGVLQASAGTGTFIAISNALKIASFSAASSIKVLGVAFLQILPWLGLISMALGAAWTTFKKVEEMLIGKEVIAARKELDTVTKHLTDVEKEYLRIKASTATAAAKELAMDVLISNSINEQVAAIEKLIKAEKERADLKNNPEKKMQKISSQDISSGGGTVTAKKIKSLLIEDYYSSTVETSEAVRRLIGDKEALDKLLASDSTGAKSAEIMRQLATSVGGVGGAVQTVNSEFVNLSNTMSDFVKSATPTTPYDKLTKSLTSTVVALSNAQVELSKGKEGADKFANVLTGISGETMLLLTQDTAQAVADFKELEGSAATLVGADRARYELAKSKLPNVMKELAAQQQLFATMQNQAIVGQSLVQLAQAYATKLGTSEALTAKDTIRRLNAEDAVLGIQAAQLKAQGSVLTSIANTIEARMHDYKVILDSNAALKGQNAIQQKILADQMVITAQRELDTAKSKLIKLPADYANITQLQTALDLRKKEANAAEVLIAAEESAANARAGAQALYNQAAAIGMGIRSKEVKAAEGVLTATKTAATNATTAVKNEGVALGILKSSLEIRKSLGDAVNVELETSVEYYTKILPLKRAELEATYNMEIATLKLAKAKQLANGSTTSADETQRRIDAAVIQHGIDTDSLELQLKAQVIQQLGLKSFEDIRQVQIDTVKSQIENLDLQRNILSINNEILDIKRKAELLKDGRTAGIDEELANAKKLAKEKFDAATNEVAIRSNLILMEYQLLDAKARFERENSFKQLAAILALDGPDSPTAAAYIDYITALNTSMGYTNERLQGYVDKGTASYNASKPPKADTANASEVDPFVLTAGKTETRDSSKDTAYANATLQIQGLQVSVAKARAELEALNYVTIKSVSPLKEMDDAIKNMADAFKAINENANSSSIEKLGLQFQAARVPIQLMLDALKELGPDGTLVSSIGEAMLNITSSILAVAVATNKAKDATLAYTAAVQLGDAAKIATAANDLHAASLGKVSAQLGAAASVVGQLSSILKASSDAKIANIDREIAAEQQRDGKSEGSLAKIKAMEAKKEGIARKSFEVQKKLQIAQAVISTAAAVTGILAQSAIYGMFAIPLAIAIGAMGAAQVALIAGTSYQSSASASAAATPSAVSIGSRGSSVDLAKNNTNVGGELGYLQGAQGTGNTSANFSRRAYGGYGHAGMIVGEKGPELFVPSTPGHVVANDNANTPAQVNATFHINAIDAEGVEQVLTDQKGHIIGMIREAANANGQNFLERVNTAKYRRGGRRI